MDSQIEQHFYLTYPKLFKNVNKPASESCMYWGIGCGNGWLALLNEMFQYIHVLEVIYQGPYVVADQIKEKFGRLRFYYHIESEEPVDEVVRHKFISIIDSVVHSAEELSGKICEECGARGELRNDLGWVKTLCDAHYEVAMTGTSGPRARRIIFFRKTKCFFKRLVYGKFGMAWRLLREGW